MSSRLAVADRLDLQRGVQNQPLSEREVELLHRLLSDPSLFPREFRNWVTNHASDTVDIAKSQVHGLVNQSGNVIVAPPPLIAQLAYKALAKSVVVVSGSMDPVIDVDADCDGNPVILQFFAPYTWVGQAFLRFNYDGAYQGNAVMLGSPSVQTHIPVYMELQLQPAKGMHNFGVVLHALSGGAEIVGGITWNSNSYVPGFLRISRA